MERTRTAYAHAVVFCDTEGASYNQLRRMEERIRTGCDGDVRPKGVMHFANPIPRRSSYCSISAPS